MTDSDPVPGEPAVGQPETAQPIMGQPIMGQPIMGQPIMGQPIVVPHTELSPDLLRSVLESFVLREGTDYGEREVSLDSKVASVVRQLERGEAQIVFDPQSESIDIVVVKGRPSR